MLHQIKYKTGALIIVGILCFSSVNACGPHFPNRLLVGGDNTVLNAPTASFESEIEHIKPAIAAAYVADPPVETAEYWPSSNKQRYDHQTADADVNDFKQMLKSSDYAPAERVQLIQAYAAVRKEILAYRVQVEEYENRWWYHGQPKPVCPVFVAPVIPANLPQEFEKYLNGAVLYYQQKYDGAIAVWQELLALPASERHWRTTWAAFMIGKVELTKGNNDAAVHWFQMVRTFTDQGFADSLGLASSSIGWEAQALVRKGQYATAIEYYMLQLLAGEPTALSSLRFTAQRILDDEQALKRCAKHDVARKVITAYLLSFRTNYQDDIENQNKLKWLTIIEQAGVTAVSEADRLAWIAYQAGAFDQAQRWLKLAPRYSPMTAWIDAKLLLRAGEIDEAVVLLRTLVQSWEASAALDTYYYCINWWALWDLSVNQPGDCVRGELGALELSRQNYTEALDILLRGGFWEDAAYIAERVLSTDELIEYVEQYWPITEPLDDLIELEKDVWMQLNLRYLLARRLTREGRGDQAHDYYPVRWQPRLKKYLALLKQGNDTMLSDSERAQFLWDAAYQARYEGMELMGTEVAPDWTLYGGAFELDYAGEMRTRDKQTALLKMSDDERNRIQQHRIATEKRFHYRYTALDLAWQAAELMPDESDTTAYVLCVAGSWVKVRDPEAADVFYQALVQRCGSTSLGLQAEKIRWFPKIELYREDDEL